MTDLLRPASHASDHRVQSISTVLAVANLGGLVACSLWAQSIYDRTTDQVGFDFANPTVPFAMMAWALLAINGVGLFVWQPSRPIGRAILYGAAVSAALAAAWTVLALSSMTS